jgi:hypothetical protein
MLFLQSPILRKPDQIPGTLSRASDAPKGKALRSARFNSDRAQRLFCILPKAETN